LSDNPADASISFVAPDLAKSSALSLIPSFLFVTLPPPYISWMRRLIPGPRPEKRSEEEILPGDLFLLPSSSLFFFKPGRLSSRSCTSLTTFNSLIFICYGTPGEINAFFFSFPPHTPSFRSFSLSTSGADLKPGSDSAQAFGEVSTISYSACSFSPPAS